MSGQPITDEQRSHVLRLARQGQGRNAIARAVGIGAATVTRIVKDAGASFDRSATEEATKSRKADLAARRADLEHQLLIDAERLRALIWTETEYRELGSERNAEGAAWPVWMRYTQPTPTVQDQERLMRSVATAVKTSQGIADSAGDGDTAGARSMLVQLFDLLGEQWRDVQASDE